MNVNPPLWAVKSLLIIVLPFLVLLSCNNDHQDATNIPVASIEVEGNYITDGGTSQMKAIITPENATITEVEWSVSNTSIATIDVSGLLTAVSNGNVTVIASATDGSGVTGQKLVGVEGYVIPVETFSIQGGDINDGLPAQFSVSILPTDATFQEVEWSVSDESISVIDANGLLTPLANGTVTVRADLAADLAVFEEISITISGFVEPEEVPAFPGAEGFGGMATGGRGGRVVYVTNLNDSGTGSLRAAINQSGARYIVFAVSGTIQLQSNLQIRNGNVTIAGQTAPGDGITLRDYPVTVEADNVVIRYLRFRMGDAAQQEGDALGGRFRKNIIIDHCSMSWSTDECVSFYVNENTTVQWCLIAQSLRNSVHGKGAHGYGGIWGGKNATFHHNLLAHHDSRNPRLGETAGSEYALTDKVDLRNNVIYNWLGNSCYGGEAMNVNIVNCYYKPGPATSSSKSERIISIDYYKKDSSSPIYHKWGKFYISGNFIHGSSRATNDNWTYGVYNQFHSSYGTVSATEKDEMRIDQPHDIANNVTTHTAEEAYTKVLAYVGASLSRDDLDATIINDVSTGTYTYSGSNGSSNGIIDTQADAGGWPALDSDNMPKDTSGDGMPDDWKTAKGLDPNTFEANGHDLDPGYENIEVYINSLVKDITDAQY